jgi:hypothetical protein
MDSAPHAQSQVVNLAWLMMPLNANLATMERNLSRTHACAIKVERPLMRKGSARHVLLLGACHVHLKTLIIAFHVSPTSTCIAEYAVVQIQDKK